MSQAFEGSGTEPRRDASRGKALPPLRRFLLAVLFLGILGTGAELILLDHFEDTLQLIPLGLLAMGLAALVWHLAHRGPATIRTLQVLMLFFVVAGLAGLVLHYRGSAEFQLEVNPDLAGLELLLKAIKAKAPPALGPGAMIHLGLLGLAYGYRHPVLNRSAADTHTKGD